MFFFFLGVGFFFKVIRKIYFDFEVSLKRIKLLFKGIRVVYIVIRVFVCVCDLWVFGFLSYVFVVFGRFCGGRRFVI